MPESGKRASMSFASVPGTLIEAHGLADGRTAVLTTERLVITGSLLS